MLLLLLPSLLQLDLNPNIEFPTYFTLYVFLFALLVLYYLLLSPNMRALMIAGPLQKLLRWALGPDQQIKISQMSTEAQWI